MLKTGRQGLDLTGLCVFRKHLPLFVVQLDIWASLPRHRKSLVSPLFNALPHPTLSQISWGEALSRKAFVNGIPHSSFLEPGNPNASHSSTDPFSHQDGKYIQLLLRTWQSTPASLVCNNIVKFLSLAWRTPTIPSRASSFPSPPLLSLLLRKRILLSLRTNSQDRT